jgi:O-antigen/teichoic acid export membrane protein
MYPQCGTRESIMSTSRLVRNVAANYLAYALNVAIVLVLTPILLHGLGKAEFALFVLVQALYALLGWLDLGLLVGLIRFVTAARERGDDVAVREVVSTAFYGLAGLGALASALLWLLAGPVARLYDLPEGTSRLAADALRYGSIGLALDLAAFVLTSYLQAQHEFHLPNITEMVARLLRAGLIVLLIWQGYGLLAIVAVFPLVAATRLLGNLVMCRLSRHPFFPSLGQVRFASLRGLRRFSILTFLDDNVNLAFLQADVLLGARVLALPQLALIGAVRPLPGMLPQVSRQALTVAFPMIVAAEARQQHEARGRFLTIATRNWLLLSALFCVPLLLWATPLLALWLGPEFTGAAGLLRVLLLAALAASFVYIPSTLLYGIGRVGYCTIVTLSTTTLGVLLGILGGWRFGPTGLAWALVAAQVATVTLLYLGAARYVATRPGKLLAAVLIPTLPAILLAAGISWLGVHFLPHSWLTMLGTGLLTALAAGGFFVFRLKTPQRGWRATVRGLIMEH